MVVGICGSPRKAGNSEFLLNEALAVAGERGFETERLLLSELKADYCSDCGDCSKGRPCPKEDDMKGILSSLEKADGIIVASPVYFGGMTGQLKAVLDRTIPLRRQNFRALALPLMPGPIDALLLQSVRQRPGIPFHKPWHAYYDLRAHG